MLFLCVCHAKIDRSATDLRRLPCIIVERHGTKQFRYRLQSKYGILEKFLPGGELEAYGSTVQVGSVQDAPVVSLREAAKSANPTSVYYGSTCNCKKGCSGKQCSCKKAEKFCTSRCHSGRSCMNCDLDLKSVFGSESPVPTKSFSSTLSNSPLPLSTSPPPPPATTCQCKGSCSGNRCSCKKVGQLCSSICHSGRSCMNKNSTSPTKLLPSHSLPTSDKVQLPLPNSNSVPPTSNWWVEVLHLKAEQKRSLLNGHCSTGKLEFDLILIATQTFSTVFYTEKCPL